MYQSIQIIGNLGQDPEMRFTPAGQATTSFSVATSNQYKNAAGETVKETTWFRISTWGKQAEVCNQYLKKGSKVMVVGRMTGDKETGGPRIWNKSDGTPAANFEIRANEVKFLSPVAGSKPQSYPAAGPDGDPIDEDIPF